MSSSDSQPQLAPLLVWLEFEQLASIALGCYGNDWIETPSFDRLATEGTVLDRFYPLGEIPTASEDEDASRDSAATWPEPTDQIAETGIIDFPIGAEAITGESGLDSSPKRIPFANLVQRAATWIEARSQSTDSQIATNRPEILMLKSAGVPYPGLPPRDLAELYFDEFDDRGWTLPLDVNETCAELWPVYAGYVSLLDHWVGQLVKALDAVATTRPVMLVISAKAGSALPHVRPAIDRTLGFAEAMIRTPCMVWTRSPGREQHAVAETATNPIAPFVAGWRMSRLMNLSLLGRMVTQWLQACEGGPHTNAINNPIVSPHVLIHRHTDSDAVHVVTQTASLVLPTGQLEEFGVQLYRLPDDYWNMQDIAPLNPAEVERVFGLA